MCVYQVIINYILLVKSGLTPPSQKKEKEKTESSKVPKYYGEVFVIPKY